MSHVTSPEQSIDIIILAGGRGERMGGHDKGWVRFGVTSFIEATLDAFSEIPVRPIISANRNIDRYRSLAALREGLVVEDPEPGFNGPLSGLTAARPHLRSHWVFVVPCDTPRLTPLFPQRLLLNAEATPAADGFVASDGHRIQPLHCLLQRSVLQQLPDFMAIPRDRPPGMMGWTQQLNMREVDFSDLPAMFDNFNTPESVEALRCAGTQCLD